MPITIATFNVENLLTRFDFKRYGSFTRERALEILGVETEHGDYLSLRRAFHVVLNEDIRQLTAAAIRDTAADVICLQEIDSRFVLDAFHAGYVKRAAGVHYGWRRLLEGNDVRGIDVAAMSKPRINRLVSHKDHTFDEFGLYNDELEDYGLSPGDSVFRRDCLEVEVNADGKPLTLFICHFKSMSGGRDKTRPVRFAEASAVRMVIEEKFDHPEEEDWMVVGDLNDYRVDQDGNSIPNSLDPLFDSGFSVNLVDNLPKKERWTHYFGGDGTKNQLDYLLASPALAEKNAGVKPKIIRNGLAQNIPGTKKVERYPRVGLDRPKASDHCPVAVEISL